VTKRGGTVQEITGKNPAQKSNQSGRDEREFRWLFKNTEQ
jgi:hypothetical protein